MKNFRMRSLILWHLIRKLSLARFGRPNIWGWTMILCLGATNFPWRSFISYFRTTTTKIVSGKFWYSLYSGGMKNHPKCPRFLFFCIFSCHFLKGNLIDSKKMWSLKCDFGEKDEMVNDLVFHLALRCYAIECGCGCELLDSCRRQIELSLVWFGKIWACRFLWWAFVCVVCIYVVRIWVVMKLNESQ